MHKTQDSALSKMFSGVVLKIVIYLNFLLLLNNCKNAIYVTLSKLNMLSVSRKSIFIAHCVHRRLPVFNFLSDTVLDIGDVSYRECKKYIVPGRHVLGGD